MINRNNKNRKVSSDSLNKTKSSKIMVRFLTGGAIALITFSALTKPIEKVTYEREKITVEDINPDYITYSNGVLDISHTSLESLDGYELPPGTLGLNLHYNLLTDLDGIKNTEDVTCMVLEENSISKIDFDKFPSLQWLFVAGNYELYNDEFLDECYKRGINVDISDKDIEYIETIKGFLKELNLEGLSDAEKEGRIFNFVTNQLSYNLEFTDQELLDYNCEPLKYAIEGKGVCINYASLFDAMCELEGIKNFRITGLVNNKDAHTWNIVLVNGNYFLCDPTLSDTNDLCYFYSIYDNLGINLDRFYNQNDINDLVIKYQEYGYKYYVEEGYVDKDKRNEKHDLAHNSKRIETNTFFTRNIIMKKVREALSDNVFSIDFTGEEANDFYKAILIGLVTGSIIKLSKKEMDELLKKRNVKIKNVKPVRVYPNQLDDLKNENELVR